MSVADHLIVAMDVDRIEACRPWWSRLRNRVAGVKIGLQLFTLAGPTVVEDAKSQGLRVFLDLKFLDIPNTVKNAAAAATTIGAWMITVHACGGKAMLEAAREGVDSAGKDPSQKPKILAVTVLTSDEASADEVVRRATLAQECGCDGVVASAQELLAIRRACGKDFLIVTPGLRFDQGARDDQRRVSTPAEALSNGANFLIMGRPILNAPDPEKLLKDLARK